MGALRILEVCFLLSSRETKGVLLGVGHVVGAVVSVRVGGLGYRP